MKSNFKKQIIIALLGIIILSSWFCSIREVLAFIKINPANPKIQISSLQKGLVGHWNLDSESYNAATKRFTDKSAYSNHGTSANAAVFAADRMGQADRAMTFNGTTDYVNAGNGAGLNLGTGNFTTEGWIKTIDTSHANNIVHKFSFPPYYGYGMYVWNNKLIFAIGDSTINIPIFSSVANINTGEWKHVVISVDRTSNLASFYINGNLDVVRDISIAAGITVTNTRQFTIGGGNPWAQYLNGSIDEVRIYNRALSAEEILQSYNSYRPKISAGNLQKGLVLDMPMDSGYTKSATVLTDRTPYSNNGTAVNGPVIGADYTTFDGVDDYVDAGSLQLINETTFSAWINKQAVSDGHEAILTKSNGMDYGNGVQLARNGNAFRFKSGVYQIDSGNYPNGWHLVIGTFSGTTATLYVDGVYSSSVTTTLPNLAVNVLIGGYSDPTGTIYRLYSKDVIDEVRIYNRALSAAEVQFSYDKSKGRH